MLKQDARRSSKVERIDRIPARTASPASPTMGSSILRRLKQETKQDHADLERHVDLLSRVHTVHHYRTLLEVFYGVYRPFEVEIARSMSEIATWLPDVKTRMRTPSLILDLHVLGNELPEALPLAAIPALLSLPACLGCMYVLEGSTLGGQVVSREVHKHLSYTPQNGCSFFASHQESIYGMWRTFCEAFELYAAKHPQSYHDVILSARATFRVFDEWFAGKL